MRRRAWTAVLLTAVFLLAGGLLVAGSVSRQLVGSSVSEAADQSLQPYLVRLAAPNALVQANAPLSQLEDQASQQSRDEVSALLADLQKNGGADQATYDADRFAFQVRLTADAKSKLAASSLIAGIDPDVSATASPQAVQPAAANSQVSSVDYIQVYTPFMWGKVTYGGLSVTSTLYASDKSTVKGEAVQVSGGKSIVIDAQTLYFETVFVDPNSPNHPSVMISPNDWVNVVTSGINPNTSQFETDNRWIPVDDVTAWTSYQNDTVHGHTSAANSQVVITVGSLGLSSYLTNSSTPYAALTADGNGNFSASQFVTGTNPSKTIDLQQGSTGFVRVIHADNCEVYTVHGQNLMALENSYNAHGYAFGLPGAPGGIITPGVTVSRPAPIVTITLKNGQGGVKDTEHVGAGTPYNVLFTQPINGGDSVTVQINNLTLPTINIAPLAGTINLGSDQVTGTGPANTLLTVGVGQVDGYIKAHSTASFTSKQITSDGGGSFATGTIQCGTTNQLSLQPGSFGYVGYEEAHGNFVYESFAAPITDVMVNYPFVEGWVADGTVRPTVTVTDSNGTVKSTTSGAAPIVMFLSNVRLYINTYYNVTPAAFVNPHDTVTVTTGSRTDHVVADSLGASVSVDNSNIYGNAPSGATVKVIPDASRTSFNTLAADGSGNFTATNPYKTYNSSNCSAGTSTMNYSLGAAGRLYLTHPDGNRVFAMWGRAMQANENENVVEFYLYPTDNLDWYGGPSIDALTVTETHNGTNVSDTVQAGGASYMKVSIVDGSNQKVLIRGGDSLAGSFTEGPPGGPSRPAEISLSNIPLVIGIPDVDANTIGGLGGSSWSGHAYLNAPPSGNPIAIPTRSSPAFGPISFLSGSTVVDLIIGNSGTVYFSDQQGYRVWSAWAATAYPVKINGPLSIGKTVVCGKATPNLGVTIFDASNQPTLISLGHGTADGSGNFCVAVSPALYNGEAVIARDDNGTYSQPVIVGNSVYLPFVAR